MHAHPHAHAALHALCRHTLQAQAQQAARLARKRHNREIRALMTASLRAL